jgi:hypothetical protein
MIGEYEALLQSALEDQAQHYEERLCDLSRLDGGQVDAGMTKEELGPRSIKKDVARYEQRLIGSREGFSQAQEAGYRDSLTDFAWAAGFSGHAQEIKGRFKQRVRRYASRGTRAADC